MCEAEASGSPPSLSSNSFDMMSVRRPLCTCCGINRYFVLALSLLFLSFLMSSLIAFNSAYTVMTNITSSPLNNGSNSSHIDYASSELPISDRRFNFGFAEKSLSFAGGFFGSTIGTLPLNFMLQKYGPHKVLTAIGVVSTIAVAIHPLVVCWSFPLFVIVRIITGFSVSLPFPVAGHVVNQWAPIEERGLFVAVISAYVELSALITMPLGGVIAIKVSWDWVFYLHAIACGFFTLLWVLYFRDKPSHHPFVGDNEWKRINLGKQAVTEQLTPPVKRIFRTPVIWAVWTAVVGNYLIAQFLISYSNMYFAYVLGYPTMTASFLTAAPLASQLVIKLVTGLASDRLSCVPELGKLRLFSSISLLGAGLLFILLCIISPVGNAVDVVLIVLPVALIGFTSGGYPKCVVLVSRQYSPFVMSIVQIVAGSALLGGSFLVPSLVSMSPSDTFDDWRKVFLCYAFVLTLTNTIFVAFARSEPAKWTVSSTRIRPLEPSDITVQKF